MERAPDMLAASEAWPADRFEQADRCLFCQSRAIEPYLCGVRDWYFGAVPGEFDFGRCVECGSLLLLQRLKQEHLGLAYADYYTHDQPTPKPNSSLLKRVWRHIALSYQRVHFGKSASLIDSVLAQLVLLLPGRKRELDVQCRFSPVACGEVLDFGCGNGDFLARMTRLGCHCIGVEADSQAAAIAQARELEVYTPQQAVAQGWADRFDLVTANHVIEHVSDPTELLRLFQQWLKPGGTLFLEVPNAQASGLGICGRFWRGLEAPRHLSIPSKRAIGRALAIAGFEALEFVERSFVDRATLAQSQSAMSRHAGMAAESPDGCELDGPSVLTIVAKASG